MSHQRSRGLGVLLAGAFVFASGCAAARPVLYPNERLMTGGSGVAQRDIDECLRFAEQYVGSGGARQQATKDVAGRTAAGAAVGAATGAVAGAIYGDPGKAAAAGAATGATAGLFSGMFGVFGSGGPSPTHKAFVERCLRERGYEPIGWE